MANQILKAFTMFTVIGVLGLVMMVVPATGQSRSAVAHIPFSFTVGDQTLEPGEYRVGNVFANDGVLRISSRESKANAVRMTHSIQASKIPEKGKLVFRRYGEQYFLSEVWTGGNQVGQQLLKSKREKAIERERGKLAQKAFEKVELELVAAVR